MEAGSGNSIVVSYEKLVLTEPRVGASQYVPAGNYAKIAVTDTGKGIAAANLIAVFDPYFSTKARGNEKGRGLGLAVVYSTLRNQGGYVTIDSALERGTTVTFYLPVADHDASAFRSPSRHAPLNRTVAVIDEDEQSRQVTTVLLEYLGFGVIADEEGCNVADLLEQGRKRQQHVVAALVNVSGEHPEGGIGICERIHEVLPDIQVIATCSSPTAPVMTNARSFGFYNALPKPYTIDDLRNMLSLAGSVG
jgi:CheY-like chemotaxis protein